MKKLSEVFESAWGDMRRRSTGKIIRKEDDINLYTPKKMYEYINDHYERIDNRWSSVYIEESEIIFVPLCMYKVDSDKNQILTNISYDYKKNVILIFETLLSYIKFNENFIISNYDEGRVSVSPKKGEVNNRFFIETLDYILDNLDYDTTPVIAKKKVNESAWGDMRRRSTGEIVRKEDDIDNLDMSEMYEYILSKYETTDNRFRIYFDEDDMPPVIGMLIFRKDEKMYSLKLFSPYISGKIRVIRLNSSTSETDDEVLKVLLKKFRVEVTPDNQLNITKYNYSVTSPVTNQLCIDVIDTIIENAKEPLIKKKDE